MNAWDIFPNAKHIDRVLDSLKRNPRTWKCAWIMTLDAEWEDVWEKSRSEAWAIVGESWNEVITNTWNAAYAITRCSGLDAAWSVIVSLIAYDDCGYMLDSTPDELRVLSALGDCRAPLMLPAAYVFSAKKSRNIY